MNGRAVLFVLGNLLLILALCLALPLIVAAAIDSGRVNESAEIWAFVWPLAGALLIGGVMRWAFKGYAGSVGVREGFAIVTFSWLVMAAVGTLPYVISGVATGVTDGFFETISGFTTTGATVFQHVERIPHGVQLWRHMTQWLGGMGIVVLSVALLPVLGVGGYRMLKAEAPGGMAYEREQARITDAAKNLWRLYLILSGVLMGLYWFLGMDLFDAVCHAFTTMATGGFSTHTASIGFYDSAWIQWVVILFMFVAGTNFALHAHLLIGDYRAVLRNAEWRLYVGMILGASILGVALLWSAASWEAQIRAVVFQVVSVATTTGYATADFDTWPQFLRFVMLLLMLFGGSMGSTAGGIKMARLAVYIKAPLRELRRLIYPHAVQPMRMGNKILEPGIASNILAFGLVYTATAMLGTFVLGAAGYDLPSALSASISALSNVGPGLGAVGPSENWGHLPAVTKWVMGLLMLMGRLELYSVLVLTTPWVWKR